MTKSIFSENVVKKMNDIVPMLGHEIVVYEKKGDTSVFFRHLSENERFEAPVQKKSLFDKFWNSESDSSYVGFAVNMNRHLKSTHSVIFLYDDFNSFDLTYSIEYQVGEVVRLVAKVVEAEEDALKKLREIVADEIENKLLRFLPLELIADNQAFTQYAQNIAEIELLLNQSARINEQSHKITETYRAINEQAADAGLRVNRINLSRRLSEVDIVIGRQEIDIERDQRSKIREIEIEANIEETRRKYNEGFDIARLSHENELERLRREAEIVRTRYGNLIENIESESKVNRARREIEVKGILLEGEVNLLPLSNKLELNRGNLHIRKATNEAIEKALLNIGDNINTPNGLGNAVRELSGAVFEVFSNAALMSSGADGGGGMNQNELPAATAKLLSPRLKDKSLTEAVKTVSAVVGVLNEANISVAETKSMMSAVLHLLGELLLADEADEEKAELYFSEIEKRIRIARQHLSAEQAQQLKSLFKLESLKKRFE